MRGGNLRCCRRRGWDDEPGGNCKNFGGEIKGYGMGRDMVGWGEGGVERVRG